MDGFRALCRTLLIWLRIIPAPDLLARTVADHPSPDSLETGWIYVVVGPGYQKWAYFRCPVDRGQIIQLSLMKKQRPRWSVTIDFLQRPTLNPSVRQLEGSYAYFWVRKGQIDWCADSGVKPHFK
jgi:hypothetical protein